MTTKKILIVYSDDNRMESAVEREFMWKLMMDKYSHLETDATIMTPSKRMVTYTDGTVIEILPIYSTSGHKHTHVYVSQALLHMAGGKKLVNRLAEGFIATDKFSREESFMVFDFVQGQGLEVKTYEEK
ncbi:hypothetical protein AB3N02_22770 [Priestia aryabhattai]|uniref:hypothetical protein n=1 Tax=Priestia aryabhattai TaxID=412384 RepID=UPI0039A1D94C